MPGAGRELKMITNFKAKGPGKLIEISSSRGVIRSKEPVGFGHPERIGPDGNHEIGD